MDLIVLVPLLYRSKRRRRERGKKRDEFSLDNSVSGMDVAIIVSPVFD